jgi:hypothetical protein
MEQYREPQHTPLLQPTVAPKAAEVVHAAVPEGESPTGAVVSLAAVQPTQVRRPWRATLRTAFAGVIGFAALLPFIVEATGLEPEVYPWLAGMLAVAAAVTRVMALPQVEDFLQRFFPFLSAAGGNQPGVHRGERGASASELALIVLAGVVVVWFIIWLVGGPNAR